jgi:hypothetical protein
MNDKKPAAIITVGERRHPFRGFMQTGERIKRFRARRYAEGPAVGTDKR